MKSTRKSKAAGAAHNPRASNAAAPTSVVREDDWICVKGPVPAQTLRRLSDYGSTQKVSLTGESLFTVESAKALGTLESIQDLWIWRPVTRSAMRHIIGIAQLQRLDVVGLAKPGKLEGFDQAHSLEEFRCNYCLTAQDLVAVSQCKSLRELGAQGSELTRDAFDAIVGMPSLEALDIEGTGFGDDLAFALSESDLSQKLRKLDVGSTAISRLGLQAICRMKRLHSLDLWATNLSADDLDLLADLPDLTYVSVGQFEGESRLDVHRILSTLTGLKSLRRIWLDGLAVTPEMKASLEKRFENVRITQ